MLTAWVPTAITCTALTEDDANTSAASGTFVTSAMCHWMTLTTPETFKMKGISVVV